MAPVGVDELRKFAGNFASGVVVLTTTGEDGVPHGLTMNAVSCVCLDPPLFLACVDKRSATLPPLLESGAFALNILARDQGKADLPLIEGALASAEFRVVDTLEVGDHVVVVGLAVAATSHDDAPLGYFRGKYARIEY